MSAPHRGEMSDDDLAVVVRDEGTIEGEQRETFYAPLEALSGKRTRGATGAEHIGRGEWHPGLIRADGRQV